MQSGFMFKTCQKVYYTVTFDGNGGRLISGEEVQQVQCYANASPPVYEKTGYTLIDTDGWGGITFGITEDKTIIAEWKINTYIITFHGNGGVFTEALYAEIYSSAFEFNASIVEPKGMYKPLYELASWRIENGSDNFVINEHSKMPAENVVLYANWVEKEGTLGLVYEDIDEETCKVIGLGEVTDKDIVIPSEYEGKAVVSIGDNAFENCIIEAVKMSDSITRIGENAFLFCDCSALKEIYINAVEPPDLDENAFNGLSDFDIYVPADSLDAYKVAEGWSEYAERIYSQES